MNRVKRFNFIKLPIKPKALFLFSFILLIVFGTWFIHLTWESSLQDTSEKAIQLAEAGEAGFQKEAIDQLEVGPIAENILCHHERWDGKGYPQGLKGEEILLSARIIGVADAYDAMTSDRPYRKALGKHEAIREVERNSGTQFDPNIAKIFIEKVLVDN